ncbi:MAG: hypothetical protein HZC41_26180 [Chloroflexi bacterium]|nr:hypothetical protein [Chloroflexota bacterium]
MMFRFKRQYLLLPGVAILVLVLIPLLGVQAGDRVLSNNQGDASTSWFITGEPTLVMNGFDLTPLGLQLPAVIDRVSIAVDTPVATTPVDVVVYQDANGGSPVDAVLAGQTQVTINQTGVVTVTFPTPVTVTQPVVWIGFYLPVDFKFLADTSGTSVLTYWAWTPGGRFNLANLASAQVLGPADGTAPVNIDMQGIARITGEISSAAAGSVTPGTLTITPLPTISVSGTPATAAPVITQIAAAGADLSVLRTYAPACDTLSWDTADVGVTFRGGLSPTCTAIWPGYAPPSPLGFARRQLLYDVTFYNTRGAPITGQLPAPVTHCIRANPADIDLAVIGAAYGSPRRWELLPTLRIGDLICAEVRQGGNLSYFIPGVETATPTPTATPKP